MRKYWLMKSEPEVFSYDDLVKNGRSQWDGVRNFEARNNLQAMQVGDLFLFYHSNATPPGVVGVGEIVRSAYPDPTQFVKGGEYFDVRASKDRPLWFAPDVAPHKKFSSIIPLESIRAHPELSGMRILQKGSRLSVTPVSKEEYEIFISLAGVG